MTARDDLIAQLQAITADGRADLIPDLVGEFPCGPDRSRAEVADESKLYGQIAKTAADLEPLFAKVDSEWLEDFFDVTEDRRLWLKTLSRHFAQAAAQEGDFADAISKGGTGGQRQTVFLDRIGEWCVTAFEKLNGSRPARTDPKLVRLFLSACEFAGVNHYDDSNKDGVQDFQPLRKALLG